LFVSVAAKNGLETGSGKTQTHIACGGNSPPTAVFPPAWK